jgi:DNA-binding NarL/FixJ family response regulator
VATVLLADRQPLFNQALARLLEEQDGYRITGPATSREGVLASVGEQRPDLVLLDAKLGLEGASSLLEQLLAQTPTLRVLVLAAEMDLSLFVSAMRQGALAVVLKTSRPETILRAVRATLEGGCLVPRAILPKVFRELVDTDRVAGESPLNRLSSREKEVLALLGRGWDNAAIGSALFISPHTVRTHIENILEKLEMHSKLQAATFAMQWAAELSELN